MNETKVLNEFFIWEEKNLIEPKLKSENNGVNEHKDITIEIKNDLTPNDWKDITNPKLRKKMRNKAYYEKNNEEILKRKKVTGKVYRENNKDKISSKQKAYREANGDKIKVQTKAYNKANKAYKKTYYEVNKDKDKIKLQKKAYKEDNKDRIKEKSKIYRESNKDTIREYYKAYNNVNKDKIKVRNKAYYEANKDKIKAYREDNKDKKNNYSKNRKKTNIQFKLSCNLRARLNSAINRNYKAGSAVKDLGCTIEQLKQYLESKFHPEMTWDNWTLDGWHIDHIKPLASFDLTDRQQLLEACHYTNLQPLWAKDNLSKSDNII